jgi:FMN reductase
VTNLLAVNSSPSRPSRTRAVAELAIELEGGRLLDLGDIDAEALLQRRDHPSLDEARGAIAAADLVLLATPVYRATYSGLLKVFLDLLPQDGLAGKACVLVATGRIPGHLLSLDAGLRVAVASIRGWSVPTVVYAVPQDFDEDGRPLDQIRAALVQALAEARLVGNACASARAEGTA